MTERDYTNIALQIGGKPENWGMIRITDEGKLKWGPFFFTNAEMITSKPLVDKLRGKGWEFRPIVWKEQRKEGL